MKRYQVVGLSEEGHPIASEVVMDYEMASIIKDAMGDGDYTDLEIIEV